MHDFIRSGDAHVEKNGGQRERGAQSPGKMVSHGSGAHSDQTGRGGWTHCSDDWIHLRGELLTLHGLVHLHRDGGEGSAPDDRRLGGDGVARCDLSVLGAPNWSDPSHHPPGKYVNCNVHI